MAEGFTYVPEMELWKSLNVFYTSYGHLTKSKVLPEVVETAYAILQKIQETSEMFKGEVVKVGSSASKVSAMFDDESDLLFPIYIEGQIEATEDPEYVKFKLLKRCVKIWEICSDNEYLSPSKFSNHFYDLVNNCLEKLKPDGKIELEGKGTVAATLNCCHEKFDFSVDLVPAVRCKPWSTNPYWMTDKTRQWPPRDILASFIERGTELVSKSSRDGGNYWRLSFSHAETELVTSATLIFPTFGKLLVIWKTLRKLYFSPQSRHSTILFKSYHLKILLLHEAIDNPNKEAWENQNLALRFKLSLERLRQYIKAGFLPHLFIPTVNLFSNGTPYFVLNHKLFTTSDLADVMRNIRKLHRTDFYPGGF
ncbi:MB21D1 [Mytilus coruscus]|uniref:MB21D1 n=1 Tax=Mytilus coruscus TaxID=42192 RepID=A0A6J8BSD1_MYTCO|nr:MB21D1 [Mytilus coruscus]